MIVTATKDGVKPFGTATGSARVRIVFGTGCNVALGADASKRFEITSDSVEVGVDKASFMVYGADRNIVIEEIA